MADVVDNGFLVSYAGVIDVYDGGEDCSCDY